MVKKLEKRQRITIFLLLGVVIFNITFRIYMRVRIYEFSRINTCYEKLITAYNAGGKDGIYKEIENMRSRTKLKIVNNFLGKTKLRLEENDDPLTYLQAQILEKQNKISRNRKIMLWFNAIILTLIAIRIIRSRLMKKKTQERKI